MHLYHLPSARIPFLGLRLQILNQRLLGQIEKRTDWKKDKLGDWTEKWGQLCWWIAFSPERFGACKSSLSSKTQNKKCSFYILVKGHFYFSVSIFKCCVHNPYFKCQDTCFCKLFRDWRFLNLPLHQMELGFPSLWHRFVLPFHVGHGQMSPIMNQPIDLCCVVHS